MILLGLDFETTGLDIKTCDIIEIGAVLWDTSRSIPLKIYNQLITGPASLTDEITQLTGITRHDLDNYGVPLEQGRAELLSLLKQAELIVAHNGTNFDRPIFQRLIDGDSKLNWIDTSVDVTYPKAISTRKLTHLAAEHNFLNPFAHRAVSDVLTMLKVLANYDILEIRDAALIPNITVQAHVSYDERELAKSRGYRWEAPTKSWIKTIKENLLEKEAIEAGFEVSVRS